MNDLFNAKRFALLFIKHTAEHYKTYLMALAVLIGVMVLGGSFLVYLIPGAIDKQVQGVLYVPILFLAGTIFTSTVFADFGDPKKAIASLTLPASNFEKFLVGWLFSYVLFFFVFTGSFYLILVILLHLKHFQNQPAEFFNIFSWNAFFLFTEFSLLHSITICGAIVFNKLQFIKTAFCFFIAIAFLILVNTLFIEASIGREIRPAIPFSNIEFVENNRFYDVGAIRQTDMAVPWLIIAVAIIFWTAAYYRMKEKEV
jgi:hypothetical protein